MIKEIQKVKNLGKFEDMNSNILLEKNSLIFGFNGTGKSTLSDMFYSMSQNNNFSLDNARTTLKREESEEKRIYVELKTDTGIIKYESGKWNSDLAVKTFNERYIEDYVMMPERFKSGMLEITLSKEARKLVKKQKFLEDRMQNECMPVIKECLVKKSDIFKNIKGIGAVKTLSKRSTAKISALSQIKLYSQEEQVKIKNELSNSSVFSEKVKMIENCLNNYKSIEFKPNGDILSYVEMEKLLRKIPRTSSKLIAKHMEHYMKKNNLTWLLAGYYNQRSANECPYCGQPMQSDYARKIAKEIERFTMMKGMENAKEIRGNIRRIISHLNREKIEEAIAKYNNIIETLADNNILTATEKRQYIIDSDTSIVKTDIAELEKLLWEKHNNIFEKNNLSSGQRKTINEINKVFRRLKALDDLLNDLLEKFQQKLMNDTTQREKGAILQLSSDENRDDVDEAIKRAKQYLEDEKSIENIKKELDDIAGNVRTDKINGFLSQMNVKFSIFMKDKRFYVRLKDFLPEEYDENKKEKILFSDGDTRALAFAYFMSELSEDGQTIVIDDPISSLDLNRKCIMAYIIVELMKKANCQVIILSHDITFVERICNYYESKDLKLQKYELINHSGDIRALMMDEYLKTDEKVYESLIEKANESTEFIDKVLGLMSLRSYCDLKNCSDEVSKYIEMRSTFFTHTIYAQKGRIKFNKRHYNVSGIRVLLKKIKKETKCSIDEKKFIPDDFDFQGYNYSMLTRMYKSIALETICDARKKALIMRPLLEACLVKLVNKPKIDPEHIGAEYARATKNSNTNIRKYAVRLQELYRITCKYHHGMKSGSTLGISWINSDEIEFMDNELQEIMDFIEGQALLSESA
ncbi:MAG: AAA family ATPase [Lachnospiraceae bacterium]|nr:AAA family ATPase [Lachnospiraceae bacterium]